MPKNSALVSNSIFTIFPEIDGQIMMSTERGHQFSYEGKNIP